MILTKENILKKERTLKRALDTWGAMPQIKMWYEESAELTQALCKIDRLKGILDGKIRKPTKDDSVKYVLAYHQLCGEVADVKIILRQLEMMLDEETINLVETRKVDRLERRLDNNDFEKK